MNSGCPSQRFSEARRSTSLDDRGVVADAGVEAEVAAVDLAEPDRADVGGVDATRRAAATAATGSLGIRACGRTRWSMPPGSTPSAVSVPAMPVATSFSVPSPPKPTTTSTPRRAASWAKRVAWPRRLVSTSLDVVPRRQRRCTTTVLRAVTDEANELTTSRMRKARDGSSGPPFMPIERDSWNRNDAPVTMIAP